MMDEKNFKELYELIIEQKSHHVVALVNKNLNSVNEQQFKVLGEALAQCKSLTSLNLEGNDLGNLNEQQFKALGEALAQCKSLTSLNFSHNNLGNLNEQQFKALGKALAQCKSLTSLNLRWNNLSRNEQQFKALGEALAQCKSLTSLNLRWNSLCNLTEQQFKDLCEVLAQCKSLTSLNLEGNVLSNLNEQQCKHFLSALDKPSAPLLVKIDGIVNKEIQELVHRNRLYFHGNISRELHALYNLMPEVLSNHVFSFIGAPKDLKKFIFKQLPKENLSTNNSLLLFSSSPKPSMDEAFENAVREGDWDYVKRYIFSIDLNVPTKNQQYPLHLASWKGKNSINSVAILELFLSKGASPNVMNGRGWTPIHYAICSKNSEACQLYIDKDLLNHSHIDFANAEANEFSEDLQLMLAKKPSLPEENQKLTAKPLIFSSVSQVNSSLPVTTPSTDPKRTAG